MEALPADVFCIWITATKRIVLEAGCATDVITALAFLKTTLNYYVAQQPMLREEQLTSDQRGAIEFLQTHESGILWADVGVGKTISALTALLRLFERFDVGRCLVVGPRLVSERVWSAEVANWVHTQHLTVSRVVGNEKQRLKALGVKADLYTVTRDNVAWLESLFIRVVGTDSKGKPQRAQYRKWPFDTIILDESQSFMSSDSQRFDSMRRLRRLPGVNRVHLLTGSFLPNGYRCAWSQAYLVDGGKRLGTSEDAFLRRFYVKEVKEGVITYDLRPGAAETIDRLLADVMHVMRDAQPAVPVNIIKVQMSKEERIRYNTMKRENVIELAGKQVNAVNAGVLWGKLLQMANGAVYDGDRCVHEIHTRKTDALVEIMDSFRPEARVLIGYGFQHDLDRAYAALERVGTKGLGRIRTNQSLNDWKSGKITKGLIHPQSAGHGLNDLKDAEEAGDLQGVLAGTVRWYAPSRD